MLSCSCFALSPLTEFITLVLVQAQLYVSPTMTLPVLDLLKYTRGNAQEQEQFSRDLLSSFQAHGFVKIVNHGFDREYIDQLMDWVGSLALLPLDQKYLISLLLSEPSVFQIRSGYQSFDQQSQK